VPEPVILYGQEWCYDAGDDYYRLGAVSRAHWSAPDLTGQLYSAKGDVPVLVAVCDAERFELSERLNSFRRSRE
jgi:hypothetical protein